MGWLFSPDPESNQFDGLRVDAQIKEGQTKETFSHGDFWTTVRPFADADKSTDAFSDNITITDPRKIGTDQADDWSITAEKSSWTCASEIQNTAG